MHRKLAGSEPGLVACWRMDEGTGQFIEDVAGGNNGQLGISGGADGYDPVWTAVTFPH